MKKKKTLIFYSQSKKKHSSLCLPAMSKYCIIDFQYEFEFSICAFGNRYANLNRKMKERKNSQSSENRKKSE